MCENNKEVVNAIQLIRNVKKKFKMKQQCIRQYCTTNSQSDKEIKTKQ